ncbi:unnamed protein product, partial [Onchocerca ochengi]|uniref:Cadherin domain-containing protein n=1 Tax=Onchocerca ochengi TaxID=42157 RepID=A0A182E5Z4_ONCOC
MLTITVVDHNISTYAVATYSDQLEYKVILLIVDGR